jgi:hypothetical protein
MCAIVLSFKVFCFLFIATCGISGWDFATSFCVGGASYEKLNVKLTCGSLVTLEVDMNAGTIDFAIGEKLVGRVAGIPKGVHFGIVSY